MEKKDLIIGVFSNYGYDDVKPWVKSSKDCGFKGDVVLVAIGASEETCQRIEQDGVRVIRAKKNGNTMIHMERFSHIYKFLKENPNYDNVITTDVRDVIFQKDPSEWFEFFIRHEIVSSGEAIKIKDEDWNKNNIIKNFGQEVYDEIKDEVVQCVGILAGQAHYIKELCFYLYNMSLNRPDWVADQAAYNVIIHRSPWKELTYFAKLEDAWAINGHVTNYEKDMKKFEPYLLEQRPTFESGQILDSKTQNSFYIVHQYDRVRPWKKYYEEKYGVKINSQYTPDDDMIVINTGV